ncbi:hypothetical protein HMPREF3230_00383, partial [Gardnerella vaginalis]
MLSKENNNDKILPVKKIGPIVAGIIVGVVSVFLLYSIAANRRFEWNIVLKYIFNENVLSGIFWTLW